MKKLIITEQERQHIKGLYEQSSNSDFYSSILGYLDTHGDSMRDTLNIDSMDLLQAKKDVMIYCEDMRDGRNPKPLSTPESKSLYTTIMKLINGSQNIGEYIEKGRNIKVNDINEQNIFDKVKNKVRGLVNTDGSTLNRTKIEKMGYSLTSGNMLDDNKPLYDSGVSSVGNSVSTADLQLNKNLKDKQICADCNREGVIFHKVLSNKNVESRYFKFTT